MKTTIIDLSKYSRENLKKIYKFTKMITDQIQIEPEGKINSSSSEIIIPLKGKSLDYDECLPMTWTINAIAGKALIKATNEEHRKEQMELYHKDLAKRIYEGPMEAWSYPYDFLRIHSKSKLILRFNEEDPEPFYQIQQAIAKAIDQNKQNKKEDKIKIFISSDKGIYSEQGGVENNYPIENNSKRKHLLYALKDGKKDGKILMGSLKYKTLSLLSGEITSINKNFKRNTGVEQNLIVSVDTGGYRINNEQYNVEFVD